jgi:chromosome segregation ATPase
MNVLNGMEKFSSLEGKIYVAIEHGRRLRDERDKLEKEVAALRSVAANAVADKEEAQRKLKFLIAERKKLENELASILTSLENLEKR